MGRPGRRRRPQSIRLTSLCSDRVYCRPSKIGNSYVDYCHQHNLVEPDKAGAERHFGIRVTLPATDTLRVLLGDDWERLHWFTTKQERDAAFDDMATRHGYYRNSDSPTQVLEKIDR